jgi:hypothetical protein
MAIRLAIRQKTLHDLMNRTEGYRVRGDASATRVSIRIKKESSFARKLAQDDDPDRIVSSKRVV